MKPLTSYFLLISLISCTVSVDKSENKLNKKNDSQKIVAVGITDVMVQLKNQSDQDLIEINAGNFNELPNEIYSELSLKILVLNCNNFPCLTTLSPEISKLQKLEIVNISKSSLTELPTEISLLKKLKVLNVAGGGKLNYLPESIGNLENLEILNLFRNNLSELPKSFAKLTKLKKVNLIENNFTIDEQKKIKLLLPDCEFKFEF